MTAELLALDELAEARAQCDALEHDELLICPACDGEGTRSEAWHRLQIPCVECEGTGIHWWYR